ncbi:MAG: serine hydrolase domain-containing protein [Bacillota bacterium]
MFKNLILFLLIGVFMVGVIYAQGDFESTLTQKLDGAIQMSLEKNRIPGLAVAALQNGEVVYSRGFGQKGKRGGEEITEDTPFYIGSISKSFTALAIMQLVEAGQIELDKPVREYLPFFQVDQAGFQGEITVRHLLHHRSGLTESEYIADLPGDMTIAAGVRDLNGMKLSGNPGENFSYFNPNYNILGLIIEEVSGQSYEDYLTENILQPLDMGNTYLYQEEIEEVVVSGHGAVFSFPVQREEQFKRYDLPSGYIVSTANDMAKFLLYQQHGEYNGRQLLSSAGHKLMHTPGGGGLTGYGMGWKMGEKFGYRIVEHGGSLYNYSSNLAILPDEDVGVIILLNQNHFVYSIISNNQIVDNILRVLLQPEMPLADLNVLPLGNIFLISAFIAGLILIKELYQLFHLKKWEIKMSQKSRFSLYFNIILEFLGPVFFLVGVPLIFKNVFGRALTLEPAFKLMPGVLTWIILISIISLLRGILKILRITSTRGN